MAFKFENLDVWKESVKFASDIYSLTKKIPKHEQFGLISQLNRAAVSISANIAEGEGRSSDPDLKRFIQIAIGSLNEVATRLYICKDQRYVNDEDFELLYGRCEGISKELHSFQNYFKRK